MHFGYLTVLNNIYFVVISNLQLDGRIHKILGINS